MSFSISSARQPSPIQEHRWAQVLGRLLAWPRAAHGNPSQAPRHAEEAIEILSDTDSSPDMRDWAEQYLCGMTPADMQSYLQGRRSQS